MNQIFVVVVVLLSVGLLSNADERNKDYKNVDIQQRSDGVTITERSTI